MALTANRTLELANTRGAKYYTSVVTTAAVIYKHAFVVHVASAGTLSAASDATTTRLAMLAVDNPDGSGFPVTGDGSAQVTCVTNIDVLAPTDSVVQGDLGDAAYAYDDESATDVNTLGPQLGTIVKYVDASNAWISLGAATMADAS